MAGEMDADLDADAGEDEIPSFPTVDGEQRVALTRKRDFRNWSGPPDQLVRAASEVEATLGKVYNDKCAELSGPEAVEGAKKLGEDLRLRVIVTGSGGIERRSGDLRAILAEMDLKTVDSVQFGNKGFPRVTVRLGNKQVSNTDRTFVKVSVSGSDRQWVGGVVDVLARELAKGEQWWSVFRKYVVAFILAIVTLAGAVAAVIAIGDFGTITWGAWLGIAFYGLFGSLAIATVLHVALQALFPAFELVEPGSSPQGRRVIGGLIPAISLIIGVAGIVLTIALS